MLTFDFLILISLGSDSQESFPSSISFETNQHRVHVRLKVFHEGLARVPGSSLPAHTVHDLRLRSLEELSEWCMAELPAMEYQLLTASHHELTQHAFTLPTTSMCPLTVHARHVRDMPMPRNDMLEKHFFQALFVMYTSLIPY